MKCPNCKKARLRQQLSVFVDCDFECRSLNKKGIRKRDVNILGAGWPQAVTYCPKCGFREDRGSNGKYAARLVQGAGQGTVREAVGGRARARPAGAGKRAGVARPVQGRQARGVQRDQPRGLGNDVGLDSGPAGGK